MNMEEDPLEYEGEGEMAQEIEEYIFETPMSPIEETEDDIDMGHHYDHPEVEVEALDVELPPNWPAFKRLSEARRDSNDPDMLGVESEPPGDEFHDPELVDAEHTAQSKNKFLKTRRISDLVLPPTDYYMYDMVTDTTAEIETGFPIARNIVESGTKFYIERNLFAHLRATHEPSTDAYLDEAIELQALAKKPPSFIIFGKPGIGATTLAKRLALKLNSVYISPGAVLDYFKDRTIPEGSGVTQEEMMGILTPEKLLALIHYRILEFDVLHRGYILDGVPMIRRDDMMTVEEQVERMKKFPIKPQYIVVMHMQDVDLFRRRSVQKMDIKTGMVYTRTQYLHAKISSTDLKEEEEKKRKQQQMSEDEDEEEEDEDEEEEEDASTASEDQDYSDAERKRNKRRKKKLAKEKELEHGDFPPLSAEVIDRLVTRDDDSPAAITDDLQNFRRNMCHMEKFIESCDRRKVLELNAYFSPSVLVKNVLEFTEGFGITPVPITFKLVDEFKEHKMLHSGEEKGEWTDSEGPFEEQPCAEPPKPTSADTDWDAVLKACTVRARVDPRFRWRTSRWKNLCPVALKNGRSVAGKPEFAMGFMNKVYFLSSERAIEQFQFNPRPYLLPTMPTSPIKFFVVGHPLAGKTLFSHKLAEKLDATVIDMVQEVKRRWHLVKFDYLFRTRLEATIEMMKKLDKENFQDWKRQERERRSNIFAWIDAFIKRKADEILNQGLQLEADELKRQREALVQAAMKHELSEPYSGGCQSDRGAGFTWKEFVQELRDGKRNWTHQETLELAWYLFNIGKLKYKMSRKAMLRLLRRQRRRKRGLGSGDEEESGDEGSSEEGGEDEGLGSSEDDDDGKKKRRRRRRPPCKKAPKKEEDDDDLVEVESQESSVFGPDSETDESIKMRFPEIPDALIFAIPRPANVTEKHPLVEDYVLNKMIEAEKWADGDPPELYCEVLRRAIKEIETSRLIKNSAGPLSGGWIVENLVPDIAKWRTCLRHPETGPDNVVGLLDHSDGSANILMRLKKNFRKQIHNLQYQDFMRAAERYDQVPPDVTGENTGEGGTWPPMAGNSLNGPPEQSRTAQMLEKLQKDADAADTLTAAYENEAEEEGEVIPEPERQLSVEDSELEIVADPKLLLEEWLQTFDPNNPAEISEPPVGGRAGESMYTQPKPEMERWIARRVNYEMLTTGSTIKRKIRAYEEDRDENLSWIDFDLSMTEFPGEGGEDDVELPNIQKQRHLDDISYLQYMGFKVPSFFELGGEDNPRTPSALLSEPDIVCPEDGVNPEDPPCVPFKHQESLKSFFLRQITTFDEFWNMAVPLMHDLQIRLWDMGVVDEDTVKSKIGILWDELELRFTHQPKRVDERELMDEFQQWQDASQFWTKGKEKFDKKDDEVLGESDYDEGETDEFPDPYGKLERKPEEYLKSVTKMDETRLYGDVKDYCPVTLLEHGILRKGFTKYAVKFRDQVYLMGTLQCFKKFMEDPLLYLPLDKPFDPPPPRICITGAPGSGQESVALKLAEQYKIYCVNFRERLQELIRAKVGTKVGPEVFDFQGSEDDLGSEEGSTESSPRGETKSKSQISINEFAGEGGEGYDPEWAAILAKQKEYNSLLIKKLGVLATATIAVCPINDLERTEKIAGRNWEKTSKIEAAIKDFLQNGTQLPEFVLDEYIAPLWEQEPFKCRGFILVGFPNTADDMRYMMEKHLIPEFVYVVDCNSKAMRNRMLTKTVDDWHYKHPEATKKLKPPKTKPEENLGDTYEKSNLEPWGYKDYVAERMKSLLLQYHRLYTRNLKALKIAMNHNRINWTIINADISLRTAQKKLEECIDVSLKYRENLFESTYLLDPEEANVLVKHGFFQLSKFTHWCPVEIANGNLAVNLWNAPGVTKYPVLYRGYIYFIAGEKNLKQFRENVRQYVTSESPMETLPLCVVVIGGPKSGKTTLAKKLADKLGLVLISQDDILQDVLKHSFVNTMVEGNNMSPDSVNAGPQSMKMADEILSYLRTGNTVPQFMSYRALDLALMVPKAQFHGIVFDEYPLQDVHLQELLERGVVPTIVVNLQMDVTESYKRVEKTRFDPIYNYEDFTEECDNFTEGLKCDYDKTIGPSLCWYETEIRCLLNVDATLSPSTVFKTVAAKCFHNMNHMQRYIQCGIQQKPAVLEGTGPLTSLLESRLSCAFRNYDPVSLNETNDLVQIECVRDLCLKLVVEYRGEIYVFSCEKHVNMFLENPDKYTYPTCAKIPPQCVPRICCLNEEEKNSVAEHWGFHDFDPVHYSQAHFECNLLKRGQAQFCAEYMCKLYFFVNCTNLEKFMKKPQDYAHFTLPSKMPDPAALDPLDNISPGGYLIASGLSNKLCDLLEVMGTKRPRFPFTSLAKSGVLFMGYFLKTLNLKSSPEVRTYYRKAMTHILNTESEISHIGREIEQIHGKRTLPPAMKKKVNRFMTLAEMEDSQKFMDPFIPDLPFGYDAADPYKIICQEVLEEIKRKENEEEELNKYVKLEEKRSQTWHSPVHPPMADKFNL